jgi:hypothetical protein
MVLAEITRFLSKLGIRHGMAGAVALHAHGLTRATRDLDFIVEERARAPLLAHLESIGYELLHESPGFSNHLHPEPRWGRLDFIYVEEPTAGNLFGRSTAMEIFPGLSALVPRPEHLAAMKVQAMKENPARTLQDLADIESLLALPGVDEQEIRRYFERHGLAAKFEQLKRARGPA